MTRPNLNDLSTFVAVADAASFTGAAAKLGLSTSAVSHTVRKLEAELGVRLLNRTTRSVTLTAAGERLMSGFAPMLNQLDEHLAALADLREKPAGNLRITSDEYAVETVLMPALAEVARDYPDIHVEIVVDYGLIDIVAERFDAGIRLGGIIAKDMIAMPISPEMQSIVVAAPSYMAGRPVPAVPADLMQHRCINLRLPTHGNIYAWEFERNGRAMEVNVNGPLVFNSLTPIYSAALRGLGYAYMPALLVSADLAAGRLIRVLEEWTPPYEGYHIYYPSRRQMMPAFRVLLDTLRRNRIAHC